VTVVGVFAFFVRRFINPILTKMALILRLVLPGMPGAFKSTDNSWGIFKIPKDTVLQGVQQSQIQREFHGQSWSF
jgi:hypothetical protein